MPIFDEELPKKKKAHEIGEDLAALSLDELDERIELLRSEIAPDRGGDQGEAGERHAPPTPFSSASRIFTRLQRHGKRTASVNHSLSFTGAYYNPSSHLDSSGSCPLCLTPPC